MADTIARRVLFSLAGAAMALSAIPAPAAAEPEELGPVYARIFA